jgi:putative copper resistance protein D
MIEPLVIVRAIHLASTLLVAGAVSFRVFIAAPAFGAVAGGRHTADGRIALTRMIWGALVVAVISGAAWLAFLAAEIGGLPMAEAWSQGLAWVVLTQTQFGDDWMLRLAIASLLAIFLLLPAIAPDLGAIANAACTLLAAALAGSLAWAGHAAATEGFDGAIHLASDALHLVAAAAWLGGLWPLAVLLGGTRRDASPVPIAIAYDVTRRFSILGIICVATILATGVVNTYEVLGPMVFAIGADYNRLLLLKIGLFIAMLAIAAVNRLRLMPRLSSGGVQVLTIRQLQWNSLAEAGLGILILGIVAALGRISPHLHE